MDTRTLVKTEDEIAIMREGCRMLAEVVGEITPLVKVGAVGKDIDVAAEAAIRARGCKPSFKGYDAGGSIPFPATLCFSVNEEIVHGIPKEESVIKEGDVVKIDIGLIHKGYHADMARTFVMEGADQAAQDLALHARKTFEAGIAQIRHGATLNDYAAAAQNYAEGKGYGVVKNLVGHGIGTELHMPPQIPNYVSREFPNFIFREGMTVALEPMINAGSEDAELGDDGWTFVTGDGSLSAHWENTILVTHDGCEIITKPA